MDAPRVVRVEVALQGERLVSAHVFQLVQRARSGDEGVLAAGDAERLLDVLQRLENRNGRIRGRSRQRRVDIARADQALGEERAEHQRRQRARPQNDQNRRDAGRFHLYAGVGGSGWRMRATRTTRVRG